MNVVTNGIFAIAIIPECRAHSIMEWAKDNKLHITDQINPSWKYYLPCRESYGRIIRGIAADFHELMTDANVVNFIRNKWGEVRPEAIQFMEEWISAHDEIPIKKQYCHSAYYMSYVDLKVVRDFEVFDINDMSNFTRYINKAYHSAFTETMPDLPEFFYDYTVPYWEIDAMYKANTRLALMIDNYIKRDRELNSIHNLTVGNLLVNAQVL